MFFCDSCQGATLFLSFKEYLNLILQSGTVYIFFIFYFYMFCCIYLASFRSDADPDVLAKYVMALVKKDKPVNELITTCQTQLDIFLQKSKHISFCVLFYVNFGLCSYGKILSNVC